MVVALIWFVGGTLAVVALEQRSVAALEEERTLVWLGQRIYFPLARFAVLAGFIGLAYPTLLARPDLALPTLGELLAVSDYALDLQLLALGTVLLLPLVPGLERRSTLVLGAQSLALTGLLGHWTAEAIGSTGYSWWPGLGSLGLIGAAFVLGETLGVIAHNHTLLHVEDETRRAQLEHLAALAVQVPLAVSYGWALGRTLG